ncbi:hypothetical protein V2J09_004291 [Rumex salicifolius]
MAEEPQNHPAPEVVVSAAAAADKAATPEPEPAPPAPEDPSPPPADAEEAKESTFKEESNVVGELPGSQRKALDELKKLIQEALNKHEFSPPLEAPETEPAMVVETEQPAEVVKEKKEEEAAVEEVVVVEEVKVVEKVREEVAPSGEAVEEEEVKTVEAIEETIVSVSAPDPAAETEESEKTVPPEEVFLWGIPLLGDDRSDVILLKFLRARDFKVKEALAMLKKCVRWRKEFEVDSLLEEDLGSEYEKVVFADGYDKEGHPVVYNVFGEFKDKELYQSTFGDADKQKKFLKWLVQFLERTIRKLDLSPTGVCSFVLVNDLKNSPGYGKREFYKIINKFFALLQDNYPEFVAKQVCINVSWWYLAYSWVYISVFTPRSRSKFVFASSSKAAETLFRYVSPEQVPVQYGGHSRGGLVEEYCFSSEDAVSEVSIKPSSKHAVELSFKEACSVVWEVRVVGWDCSYEAQFIPEEGYTVLVAKPRKVGPSDEPIISDSFKIGEPGKLVLTIHNHTSKKKKLLYRSKVTTST